MIITSYLNKDEILRNQKTEALLLENTGKIIKIDAVFGTYFNLDSDYENFENFFKEIECYDEASQENSCEGSFIHKPLPLYTNLRLTAPSELNFHLLNKRDLKISFGGTGIQQYALNGFFKIETLFMASGNIFHLYEIQQTVNFQQN